MKTALISGLAVTALLVAGCSDSKTDAVQAFCDAQEEAVQALANIRDFNPTEDSIDDLQADREQLANAVSDLDAAQSDLNSEFVDSVQSSWESLRGSLQDLSDQPVTEAGAQAVVEAQTAAAEFEASWEQAAADADC